MNRARMLLLAVSTVALASCSISCPKRQPETRIDKITKAQAEARLFKEAERRQRLSGLFKARLGGLKGLLSADVDVAVEMPNSLHLAVRSFFGQPVQVLATREGRVTLFDARAEGGPKFYEGQAHAQTAAMLLGVPLSVSEVVDAFLGRIPRESQVQAVAQGDSRSGYTVVLGLADGGRATLVAGDDDAPRSLDVTDKQGKPRFKVVYEDFEDREGISFASSVEVTVVRQLAKGETETESLTLTVKELELNPAPFDPGIFEVGLPPGEAFIPLPHTPPPPLGALPPARQPERRTAGRGSRAPGSSRSTAPLARPQSR